MPNEGSDNDDEEEEKEDEGNEEEEEEEEVLLLRPKKIKVNSETLTSNNLRAPLSDFKRILIVGGFRDGDDEDDGDGGMAGQCTVASPRRLDPIKKKMLWTDEHCSGR